jgi:hypothetical protein
MNESALTFDMRGAWRPQAGKRPLDGRVRALLEKHSNATFTRVQEAVGRRLALMRNEM